MPVTIVTEIESKYPDFVLSLGISSYASQRNVAESFQSVQFRFFLLCHKFCLFCLLKICCVLLWPEKGWQIDNQIASQLTLAINQNNSQCTDNISHIEYEIHDRYFGYRITFSFNWTVWMYLTLQTEPTTTFWCCVNVATTSHINKMQKHVRKKKGGFILNVTLDKGTVVMITLSTGVSLGKLGH